MISREKVISGTEECVEWWLGRRRGKLRDELSDTMALNPFLAPLIYNLHNFGEIPELAELLSTGHLLGGYNTAFGKLVDEKILPRVFNTRKLDKEFRENNEPFKESYFDEVDHLIPRYDARPDLLSLKSGRWTIQLSAARNLNTAFKVMLERHGESFDSMVVGVFYGSKDDLGDKYDILRGINRGANHDVTDLTERVRVYAGSEFWTWLNDGEAETQFWVMEGILKSMEGKGIGEEFDELLGKYVKTVRSKYDRYVDSSGMVDWHRLLRDVNR